MQLDEVDRLLLRLIFPHTRDDAFGELTEDSGAAVGRCMESYKRLMDLSAEAVAVQDRLEKKIDDLTVRQLKTNEMLMKICEGMS